MQGKTGPMDYAFSEKKIIESIKVLKLNKSKFGVISNEILICSPKAISKVLCKLFNYILKNKTFPEIWNISLIKPLHNVLTVFG